MTFTRWEQGGKCTQNGKKDETKEMFGEGKEKDKRYGKGFGGKGKNMRQRRIRSKNVRKGRRIESIREQGYIPGTQQI